MSLNSTAAPRMAFVIMPTVLLGMLVCVARGQGPATAPAGYDNIDNTFDPQFEKDKDAFEEIEQICPNPNANPKVKGGLWPVYNDTACANYHQNPISGSAGQDAGDPRRLHDS